MGKAWGHQLRLLTSEEITCFDATGGGLFDHRRCRMTPHCQHKSQYMLRYNYITGQAGRISHAQKPICEQHAAKYLAQLMPERPPRV